MPVNNISSLPQGLGNLPQIVFGSGFQRQLSQDIEDFKMVQALRIGEPAGREYRFLLHIGGGPAAVQSAAVDSLSGTFPAAQRSEVAEKSTIFKEINTTIQISEMLARRLQMRGSHKYAEQLAMELEDKLNYSKRFVGRRLHLDGTGVLGTVSASVAPVDTTGANGYVTIAISTAVSARGHVNVFEFGDLVLGKTAAGAAVTPSVSGGTFAAYKVIDVRREDDKVDLAPVDANQARLSLTSSGLAAGNVFYSFGQVTIPDLTASIADYNSVSEDFVGLESLIADDGRVVNGMTMSGILRSIIKDKSGQSFDVRFLTELITSLRNRNGASSNYKWKKVLMASEVLSVLSQSWSQDRRFNAAADGKLGAPTLSFQHGGQNLSFVDSEFARKDRAWLIPESGANGGSPVQFMYSDFQASKGPDGASQWSPDRDGNGARLKSFSQHLVAFAASLNSAPASCGLVKGFSTSI